MILKLSFQGRNTCLGVALTCPISLFFAVLQSELFILGKMLKLACLGLSSLLNYFSVYLLSLLSCFFCYIFVASYDKCCADPDIEFNHHIKKKNTSPHQQKCPTCILCGIQGHAQRDCTSRLCSTCGLPSHGLRPCERPPLWNQHCQRCGVTGHLSDVRFSYVVGNLNSIFQLVTYSVSSRS